MRLDRITTRSTVGAAIALAVAAGPTLAATTTTSATWSVQPSANPSSTLDALNAVSATPGSAWAVGRDMTNGRSHPLVERLTSTGWVAYAAKLRAGDNELDGVATVSKTDAWAVGSHITNDGSGVLIEHLRGTAWSNVSAPHTTIHKSSGGTTGPAYGLQAVTAVSAKDVWAVGGYSCEAVQCSEHPLTEHFNGKKWSSFRAPNPGGNTSLSGVSGYGSRHVWATGFNAGTGQAVLLGHNRKGWHAISIPEPGDTTQLFAVTATKAKAIWAVGSYSVDSKATKTLTLHRAKGRWRRVPSPNPPSQGAVLRAVAAISANDVWAVGDAVDAQEVEHPLIEHYNGKSWSIVHVADPTAYSNLLAGVSVRNSKAAVAVGTSYTTATKANTLALKTSG